MSPRRARRSIEKAVRHAQAAAADSVVSSSSVVAKRPSGRRVSFGMAAMGLVAAFVVSMTTAGLTLGGSNATTGDDVSLSALVAPTTTSDIAAAAGEDQTLDVTVAAEGELAARDGFEVVKRQSYSTTATSSVLCAINAEGTIRWPLYQGCTISSGFGYRTDPSYGGSAFHAGVDLTPGRGQPVLAMADGVVTAVGWFGGYGYRIQVSHPQLGITSLYGHMIDGSGTVAVGDTVTVGQEIGLVGSTGKSTGAHLHFELQIGGSPVDPISWMASAIG